jgi:regulator of replication initiation timing
MATATASAAAAGCCGNCSGLRATVDALRRQLAAVSGELTDVSLALRTSTDEAARLRASLKELRRAVAEQLAPAGEGRSAAALASADSDRLRTTVAVLRQSLAGAQQAGWASDRLSPTGKAVAGDGAEQAELAELAENRRLRARLADLRQSIHPDTCGVLLLLFLFYFS